MIRLGTLFSGIGAIEQALLRMGEEHINVFACDNGELDLKLLPAKDQKEYDRLRKISQKKISPEDKAKLIQLSDKERRIIEELAGQVKRLATVEEKNEFVRQLYRRHSKGENLVKQTYLANYTINDVDFHLDVRFMDGLDYRGQVDLMVGGSPCQAFSTNGKRGGFADTRGTLFHEYARIINEVQPKCFIFENVKGLIMHDNGATWATIRNTFRELNYDIYINKDSKGKEHPTLNVKNYGVPQNRERIYLIGIRKDIQLEHPFEFPSPIPLQRTNADFLDAVVAPKYYLGEKGFEFVTTHPTRAQVGYTIQKCQKANQQFNWNGDFIFEPLDGHHSEEILYRAHVGNWNGQQGVIRMYTPRECLRLMGFPDSFVMLHTDNVMWRQSGNSIVVDVLMAIVNKLKDTGIFEK